MLPWAPGSEELPGVRAALSLTCVFVYAGACQLYKQLHAEACCWIGAATAGTCWPA